MDGPTALALALALEPEKTKSRRTKWSKKWYLKREKYGHYRLLRELRENEPEGFKNFLRMDTQSFDELLTLVAPFIQKQDTIMRKAIPLSERLSLTLRYLATGNTFQDLKFISAISPQAIGEIILETCEAIIHCLKTYIKMPRTPDEWKQISDDFQTIWNIPHCLGAIDGKHVAIKKPPGSGSYYYNYKQFFSIVLMAVVNAKYEFIMVDAGTNGRVSDGGVISNTTFGRMLEDGELSIPEPETLHEEDTISVPYFFVADDAFAMSENLLKPHGGEGNNHLDVEKRIFNYRLSRGRRVVENVFGILVSRFGIFQRQILLSPDKATTITLACCYLHNFLPQKSGRYMGLGAADWEDANHEVQDGEWRTSQRELVGLRPTFSRNATGTAKFTRETLQRYFCSRGSVPWQFERLS